MQSGFTFHLQECSCTCGPEVGHSIDDFISIVHWISESVKNHRSARTQDKKGCEATLTRLANHPNSELDFHIA